MTIRKQIKKLYNAIKTQALKVDSRLSYRQTVATPTNQTSVSDNGEYPLFCHQAAYTPEIFNSFRKNQTYRNILEHVSEFDARQYLIEIRKCQSVYHKIDCLRHNDSAGGPFLVDIDEIKAVSTTTLRYIKVLCDIVNMFPTLNKQKVYEIGVGYGGQCRIIDEFYGPAEYCLIDIRPALQLAETYLDRFALKTTVRFKTINELAIESPDILISNYAFSELPRWLQLRYMEKVICRSKMGYITYNAINPASFESFTAKELQDSIPGAEILPETPCTHKGNCIIVWGHK